MDTGFQQARPVRAEIRHSRQAFSRHLSVLEDFGIIEVGRQGMTKLHSLNIAPWARWLDGWLSRFEEP